MTNIYKAKRLRYTLIMWCAIMAGTATVHLISSDLSSFIGMTISVTIGVTIASIFTPLDNRSISITDAGIRGPGTGWIWDKPIFASFDLVDIHKSRNTIWRSYIYLKNGHRILLDCNVLGRAATKEIFKAVEKGISQQAG